MKLKKLLTDIALELYRGSREIEITGLCSNSKRVAPGNLFIAKKGLTCDGSQYIEEAIESGAVAILSDMGNPFLKDVVQLVHPDPGAIEGVLASAYYNHPSRELFTVGITGTNGKTTVAYIVKHLLDNLALSSGLISTIEYLIGESRYDAEHTTPDVITNHKMLKEMVRAGCKAAVMEVTSHGLVQRRVDQIEYDVAVFTNLTQDHLDYHQTLDNYAEAKSQLFASLSEDKHAVINIDSPYSTKMVEKCRAKLLTYGLSPDADLFADQIKLTKSGTEFQITYQGQRLSFSWPLIGRFNILNCLAAVGVCLSYGIPLEALPSHVASFPSVPGRLERVEEHAIFVDFAHTPDALQNVLQTLQEVTTGRVITLFGCGGDRDSEKRPQMAFVAEKFSDFTIVTSDNPRSEEPLAICQQIALGFRSQNHLIEPDRRRAIEKAIEMKGEEDLILIAGKGHEAYQIFSHQRVPFDDRKVSLESIETIKGQ